MKAFEDQISKIGLWRYWNLLRVAVWREIITVSMLYELCTTHKSIPMLWGTQWIIWMKLETHFGSILKYIALHTRKTPIVAQSVLRLFLWMVRPGTDVSWSTWVSGPVTLRKLADLLAISLLNPWFDPARVLWSIERFSIKAFWSNLHLGYHLDHWNRFMPCRRSCADQFENNHSKTPGKRFKRDHRFRTTNPDPDLYVIPLQVPHVVWYLYDRFFQCETAKMCVILNFSARISWTKMNLGISRYENLELYVYKLHAWKLSVSRRNHEELWFYMWHYPVMRDFDRSRAAREGERSAYEANTLLKCVTIKIFACWIVISVSSAVQDPIIGILRQVLYLGVYLESDNDPWFYRSLRRCSIDWKIKQSLIQVHWEVVQFYVLTEWIAESAGFWWI